MTSCRCCTLTLLCCLLASAEARANPTVIDLALAPPANTFLRAHGHTGTGVSGVPVAGGFDTDGDGHADFAFSSLRADPLSRTDAGEVYLLFGDGAVDGTLDTGVASADILTFIGDVTSENAGSEIWMDDVTGDGLGDLLIARQNFTPDPARIGAGALTIVVGGAALRTYAATLLDADLRTPPAALTLTTFVGAGEQDRLGIWMRTGDVTGDGIADIVVGADQVTELSETHRGAVYVIRGGSHLAVDQTVDMADFETTALPGDIARVTPPSGSAEYHFGATVQMGDLDGNGRDEVFIAAALNRAGAVLAPSGAPGPTHGTGGPTDGTLYIAWDDNFLDPWPDAHAFEISSGPGSYTAINGATCNVSFSEEMLGGLDYDANGSADLFVGDIVGNCGPVSRAAAGSGHVFFDASDLKGLDFDLQSPPGGLVITDIYGAAVGDISSDTSFHGDFDDDGIADLGIASPHASPQGRSGAGALHILFGQGAGWPATLDLAAIPAARILRVTEIHGANGLMTGDTGDTLGYSGASGDIDGDGVPDVITNEMVGNGLQPGSVDVGNLVILSGPLVSAPALPALGSADAALRLGMFVGILALGRRAWRTRASPIA